MEATEFDHIVQYLQNGSIPPEVSTSRARWNFKRKATSFFIETDKLYKTVNIDGNPLQVTIPRREQVAEVLNMFHDQVGHPGMNATSTAIQKYYMWKGMHAEIIEYVKTCDVCQQTASLPPQPQKKLHPIPPPDHPWVHIGMDLVCDLPMTTEGYKHILVTVCYLSKYVLARPLKTKTSEEVITALQDIYLEVGVPKIVQHDQGKEFTSNIFQELNHNLRIDNRSTRAYHPMANGLVEAHNKILKMKLNKMGRQTSKEWSILLKSAVLSMNSTKKRSTGHTPFKIMWGRESQYEFLLPVVNNASSTPEEDFIEEEEVFARLDLDNLDDPSLDTPVLEEERFNIYDSASQSIASEQLKQKSQYDKKVTGNRKPIVKGDMIMFTNIPKMKKMPNTKRQPKYLGPHMVERVSGENIIILMTVAGKKREKRVPIHIVRPYFERDISHLERKLKRPSKPDSEDADIKRVHRSIEKVYGFSCEFILDHLNSLKDILASHIQNGTYLTCVHKDLHEMFHQNHKYAPNTFLFTFLKDISEYDMKRQIRETLLCWSHIFYPKFGDSLAAKYTESVLYSVAIEYLNTVVWDNIDNNSSPMPPAIHDSPRISVINEAWQRQKCEMLELTFHSVSKQPSQVNQTLSDYRPWETANIDKDGNCFFRCLSHIITGNQDSHSELRKLIAHFIASQGASKLGWYLKHSGYTPFSYFQKESMVNMDGVWGGDVEIMAASAILQVDIFVANNEYRWDSQEKVNQVISWKLMRANALNEEAIYVKNFDLHFEPVTSLVNNPTPTFGVVVDQITLDFD